MSMLLSVHNRKLLEKEEGVCYYCFSEVQFDDVITWTDDNTTAVCPYCGVDSIVAGLSRSKAIELNILYFRGKKNENLGKRR